MQAPLRAEAMTEIDFSGKLTAEFACHGTFDRLEDARDRCAVVIEWFGDVDHLHAGLAA